MLAAVAGPLSPLNPLLPFPATVWMIPGESAICGAVPIPVRPKLNSPAPVVVTTRGTPRTPEKAGLKVTGIVQIVPAERGLPLAHPVTVPTAYSCAPPSDCGTVNEEIVTGSLITR